MSEQMQASMKSGVHYQLSRLAGDWEGTTKTWFDPSKLEDESPITGSMKLILDGRFILHEYSSSFKGKPLTGITIYGYHLELKKYQVAWIDSFHNGTAIMLSESNRGESSFNVKGSYVYVTPEEEHHWGWRTAIEVENDNEVVISMFNISPEGQETRATETRYKRSV